MDRTKHWAGKGRFLNLHRLGMYVLPIAVSLKQSGKGLTHAFARENIFVKFSESFYHNRGKRITVYKRTIFNHLLLNFLSNFES